MTERTLKLHQVLAIESGIRNQMQKELTDIHHNIQKPELLFGLTKTYYPVSEEGEKLPAEAKLLQLRASEAINTVDALLTKTFDTVASRDFANCSAKADVVLEDGTILISQAPATFLLWLDKKLEDLYTFVSKLPILPADTNWSFDEQQNCFRSPEIETTRSQKVSYPLVLHPATHEHPAQVVEKTREELVGHYKTIKYSGAMKAQDVAKMRERVEQVQRAVKFAREQANTVDAPKQNIGKNLLKFVFTGDPTA